MDGDGTVYGGRGIRVVTVTCWSVTRKGSRELGIDELRINADLQRSCTPARQPPIRALAYCQQSAVSAKIRDSSLKRGAAASQRSGIDNS
jgi:hypothetical protein